MRRRRDSARPRASGRGRDAGKASKAPANAPSSGGQRSTPPNGISGLSSSAARSGWSGALAPRKASNRRLTASGSRSRVIKHDAGALVAVGPARQPHRRMEDVLHAVNDDGARRRLRQFHDALEAQQVGAVHRAHEFDEQVEHRGRNRRCRWRRRRRGCDRRAGSHRGGDASWSCVRFGIGFGREPALDVGDLAGGIEQAAGRGGARATLRSPRHRGWARRD